MKINILFQSKNGPSGGGNKFLKLLKDYFILKKSYEHQTSKADIILFNSHHHINEVIKAKLNYPDKIFVHRIDGPMKLYNDENDQRDKIVYLVNKYIADATVFQSGWSQRINHELGLKKKKYEAVINNASDNKLFNPDGKIKFSKNRKIRLIATSWSTNKNKGFYVYEWLDKHLDFNKFQMTFVGNSPITFKNIISKEPLPSKELAKELKKNDIFIFASKFESCSNALLEAINCGLPSIAFNGSSNPEILGKGGTTFERPEELPMILNRIVENYHLFKKNIRSPDIDIIGQTYEKFLENVYKTYSDAYFHTRKISFFIYIKLNLSLMIMNCYQKVVYLKKIMK